MKIYVVGSSKNKFLPLDNIREKFLIDQKHEGDNIDFLNPWYCELTGIYYLWKHCDDDIVGLEHYRTYFWKDGHPINEEQIKEELTKGDIICGGYNCSNNGAKTLRPGLTTNSKHTDESFLKTVELFDKKFSDYLRNYWNGHRFWCCNIFIGSSKILNEWMKFFFDVIIEFEKKHPIGPATKTLRREGYFAEYTFGAWLEYNGYKIIHCDLLKLTKDLSKPELSMLGPEELLKKYV